MERYSNIGTEYRGSNERYGKDHGKDTKRYDEVPATSQSGESDIQAIN